MTLVVAQRVGNNFYACSDTRLVFERPCENLRARRVSSTVDAVKAIILHPALCLFYAGDYQCAIECVRTLVDRAALTLDGAINCAASYAERSNGAAEFVVAAYVGPSLQLFKITSERVSEAVKRAYLGSNAAFSDFQAHIAALQLAGKADGSPDWGAGASFDEVVRSEKHESVGQMRVSVVSTSAVLKGRPSFYYVPTTTIVRARPYTFKGGTEHVVDWGGAEEGTFSVTQFSGWHPGHEGVGFYITEARRGVLFKVRNPRGDPMAPIEIEARDYIDFCNMALHDLSMPLQGLARTDRGAVQLLSTNFGQPLTRSELRSP